MTNTGGPAFPTPIDIRTEGMTLRDWFAGQAMAQGMAVLVAASHNLNEYQLQQLAKTAFFAADAMLAERAKARGEAI